MGLIMYDHIIEKLKNIEEQHNVTILYAVESGSRGWGFASQDSDYDVRFIYAHPVDWYLAIHEKKDFIEYPINDLLDINGWDVKKALQLYKKSNAGLMEWLSSPIIYRDDGYIANELRALVPLYFNPIAVMYHYLNTARNTFDEICQAREVKLKKYFYILRPLLACRWIEKNGTMPPMPFDLLLRDQALDRDLHAQIGALIERKIKSVESDREARNEPLMNFCAQQIAYYQEYLTVVKPKPIKGNYARLDELFLSTIKKERAA